jgi:ribosome-binding factor A
LEKWANHLISAIRYSSDHKYITELVQHEDQNNSISEGTIVKKLDVTDAIKKGKIYMTIFNSNDNWKIGEKIQTFMVEGEVFIRTDKNKVERDNLGLLPEI